MGSPEMNSGIEHQFEAPKPKEELITPEASPLSAEIKDAMRANLEQLTGQRYEVLQSVQEKLADLLDTDASDTELEGSDFKGVEQVRQIIEANNGDSEALQKAFKEMSISFLLNFGVMSKIKKFAVSPQVDRLVALDAEITKLRSDIKQ